MNNLRGEWAAEIGSLKAELKDALQLVAELRLAIGDGGRRMQPELIEHVRQITKDAERYRWLRAEHLGCDDGDGWLSASFECDQHYNLLTPDQRRSALDAAIDAAMKADALPGGGS